MAEPHCIPQWSSGEDDRHVEVFTLVDAARGDLDDFCGEVQSALWECSDEEAVLAAIAKVAEQHGWRAFPAPAVDPLIRRVTIRP